jgi:hypothetical protein
MPWADCSAAGISERTAGVSQLLLLLLLKDVAGTAQLACCSSQLLTQVSAVTTAPFLASRLWLSAIEEQVSNWSLRVPAVWLMLDCQLQALLAWLCAAVVLKPEKPVLLAGTAAVAEFVRPAGKLCLPTDLWLVKLLLLVGGLDPSSCHWLVQAGTLVRCKGLPRDVSCAGKPLRVAWPALP